MKKKTRTYKKRKVVKKPAEDFDSYGGSESSPKIMGDVIVDNGKDIVIRDFQTKYLYAIGTRKEFLGNMVVETPVLVALRQESY